MIKLGKQDGWWRYAEVMKRGEVFTNASKSLYSTTELKGYGRYVPFDDVDIDDLRSAVYFVYSYGTPIAWRLASGAWVLNHTKYSVTTSAHQSKVFTAIHERFTVA